MKHPQQFIPLSLAALLGGLLCLKGGVHPRHSSFFLVGIALLGSYAILREGLQWTGQKLWLPLLLCTGITLQLLPLPSGIRAGLAPNSQIALEAVERAASPEDGERYWEKNTLHAFSVETGENPQELLLIDAESGSYEETARPLSLDPGETRWRLVVWLAGGICLLLGIRIGRGQGSARFLYCVFFLLVAEALVGLWGIRADSLLFFEKEAYLSSATGTLVNRNHFGTLMLLGLGIGGTLLVHRERSGPGPGLLATQMGTAACFAGLLASQSRFAMGLGAFGVALGLWLVLRRKEVFHKGLFYGVLALLLAFFAWRTGYFERFEAVGQDDRSLLGRLDIWSHAFAQWRGALVGGVGLGAFSWAASLDQTTPYLFQFSHAHSDILQLFVEGGILVGGVFFAALFSGVVRLSRALNGSERRLESLPLAWGLSACLIHSLVDFPFQIPGILLLWLSLAGWVWGRSTPEPRGGTSIKAMGLGATFVVLFGAHQAGQSDQIEESARRLLREDAIPIEDLRGQMEAALRTEKPGAREGLGRLALRWAESGSASLTQRARRIRFQNAAQAAQRRAQEQPLDANAYVAESLAWAYAAQVAREQLAQASENPETLAFYSEWAMHKALWLQPTNPLIYLEAAKSQLVLARESPLFRGHQRRAALLLNRAMALDPWTASKAFKMAAPLPVEDLVAMRNEEPRILYQASREMQRRGLRQDALELATRSSAMPRAPKEVHFLRAELIHSLSGIEAAQEAYRGFLASNGGPHAMRGWAFLRIGEEKSAAQAFRRALEANPDNRWAKEGLAVAEGNPFTSD